MTKYFSLTSTWLLVIAVFFGLRTAGGLRADPTDDFSFTLTQEAGQGTYRLMAERRVTEILEDRLDDDLPKSEVPALARHLLALCKQYRFDPAFVLSLIQVESDFHVKVVSPYGAVGLMQVMPATAVVTAQALKIDLRGPGFNHPGEESLVAVAGRLLTDPFSNLTFGVAYLSWLRDRYRGLTPYHLVAAYNIGPARMDELLSRKSFKPVNTKRYFEAIRRGVPGFRFYRRETEA